ncbi:uncharacterized protein LOC9638672 isoform X2 [Selaginella moellendorffii]|uniref:uncharacterized protein LOC9638672 isoform X2 n=1 Tax=Selaginella moellendorffii TaxID=88036 RepID=UPI000D1C2A62|nr:uncharacterized protein LOC9638672 isoform X2 [Selaginella moellendorffii]|eukprot:XP_024537760.1 uncharacterized protein LOC9638672 isoform X2 [Selaginella moellendorffii]
MDPFINISEKKQKRHWDGMITNRKGIKTTYVGARHLVLQVYDSRVHKWVSSCRVFTNGNEIAQTSFDDANDCMLLRENKLYFITIAKNNTRSLKCVNVWDSDGKVATLATWTSLPMGLHQEPYNGCRNNNTSLVYCAGKLVLANFILDAQTLGFVYLDEASRQWRPLATMPREILPANLRKVGLLASNMHQWSLVVAGGETEITFLMLHFEGCSGGIYNEVTGIWRTAFHQRGGALYPFKPSFNPL